MSSQGEESGAQSSPLSLISTLPGFLLLILGGSLPVRGGAVLGGCCSQHSRSWFSNKGSNLCSLPWKQES